METILLNNGKTLPLEGFGVFQIADQTLCQQAVLEALQEGYRLIDTAASYFNEEAVGRALRTSSLPRDEVFVTTKVWVQDFGEVKTRDAVLRSLEKLGLEYIDYGTHSTASVDYPDMALPACDAVVKGECSKALLFCGTGALLSPTSTLQGESIPSICHAVAISTEQ